MFRLYLFIIIVALSSCHQEEKSTLDKLKIASLNCNFLWDGLEPEEGNPAVEFLHKGNPELARLHMEKIAEVLKEVNADIVNLVEVENLDALNFLNDTFLFDMGYTIGFVKGKDTFTGQDVALLSKFPVEKITRYNEKGVSGDIEKSVSKNYIAEIIINDIRVAVIGLHLLARPMDNSRLHERQAQADAIRQIAIDKKKEGFELVILGDFNDYDGDTCCADVNNNIPITDVLNIIRELDTLNGNDDLLNVASLIPKQERFTAHWDQDEEGDVDIGERSSIDHILLSPVLARKLIKAEIKHNYNPIEVSDHFPVVAELDLSNNE